MGRKTGLTTALAVVVILVALFVFAKLRYRGKALVKLPAGNCNADLWLHVAEHERRLIEACKVKGRRERLG